MLLHVSEDNSEGKFERNFQHNNIYSIKYIRQLIGGGWAVDVEPDMFDTAAIEKHAVTTAKPDEFYGNRISRVESGKVFKGDIYMPWKFVVAERKDG